MDLVLVRRVLDLVEAQPYGFAKLRGRQIAWVAEEMRLAGLLELSAASGNDPHIVTIKKVTDAGRRLLRALRGVADSKLAGVSHWKSLDDLEISLPRKSPVARLHLLPGRIREGRREHFG